MRRHGEGGLHRRLSREADMSSTERITAFLMARARRSQGLEAEAEATASSQAGTPELETQPSRG